MALSRTSQRSRLQAQRHVRPGKRSGIRPGTAKSARMRDRQVLPLASRLVAEPRTRIPIPRVSRILMLAPQIGSYRLGAPCKRPSCRQWELGALVAPSFRPIRCGSATRNGRPETESRPGSDSDTLTSYRGNLELGTRGDVPGQGAENAGRRVANASNAGSWDFPAVAGARDRPLVRNRVRTVTRYSALP